MTRWRFPEIWSAPAAGALSDGEQMLIVTPSEGDRELVVLVGEAEDAAVEGGMPAAGRGRKDKREYRCATCGYGIVVHGPAPSCPMCRGARWEHVEWRPFSQLLDDVALPAGSGSQRRRLHTPSSPTAEQSIRDLRPGQAEASLEK